MQNKSCGEYSNNIFPFSNIHTMQTHSPLIFQQFPFWKFFSDSDSVSVYIVRWENYIGVRFIIRK